MDLLKINGDINCVRSPRKIYKTRRVHFRTSIVYFPLKERREEMSSISSDKLLSEPTRDRCKEDVKRAFGEKSWLRCLRDVISAAECIGYTLPAATPLTRALWRFLCCCEHVWAENLLLCCSCVKGKLRIQFCRHPPEVMSENGCTDQFMGHLKDGSCLFMYRTKSLEWSTTRQETRAVSLKTNQNTQKVSLYKCCSPFLAAEENWFIRVTWFISRLSDYRLWDHRMLMFLGMVDLFSVT